MTSFKSTCIRRLALKDPKVYFRLLLLSMYQHHATCCHVLYRVSVTTREVSMLLGFPSFGRPIKKKEAERLYGKEVPELDLGFDDSASKVFCLICIHKACTGH